MNRIVLVLIGSAAAALAGCASPWKASFRPDPDAGGVRFERTERVAVLEVPWERVDAAIRELTEDAKASDVHPNEWPQEKKDAAKARLLSALQVQGGPTDWIVLGHSSFKTISSADPGDPSLTEFARSIGADEARWSSLYLGKVLTTRDEPVRSFTTGTLWVYDGRRGRSVPRTFTQSTTAWVPVTVQADERAYMVFYLRRAGERSAVGQGNER